MSSKRTEKKKQLNLDSRTFGESPAALYLVELLNTKNDPTLARKVARTLTAGKSVLADLARANLEYDVLSTKTFSILLEMISEHNQTKAIEPLKAIDPFIANIVLNVLEGGVKTWRRRVQAARINTRKLAKTQPAGVSLYDCLAEPVVGEKTPELLQERSRAYLKRKGKKSELY